LEIPRSFYEKSKEEGSPSNLLKVPWVRMWSWRGELNRRLADWTTHYWDSTWL
jgi:hypothetical protein